MASSLPFRSLRRKLALPLVKLISLFAVILPRRLIRVFSGIAGFIASRIPGSSQKVFGINRRHVIDPCGLDVSLSCVYRNVISGILDFVHLSSRSDRRFWKVVEVQGGHHMDRALSLGRGVIAITAHYSAWELIPRAVGLMGHEVAVVSRKLSNRYVSEYMDELRSRHGTVLIDRGENPFRLMRVLHDNTAVGILIDQDTMGAEGEFVDFLGLPARTPVGPAQLALRFGIPVLTLHISRKPGGKYVLRIDEPFRLDEYAGEDGYLRLTADLTGRIEEWIREDPGQWVWIHERWARRPDWAPGLQ